MTDKLLTEQKRTKSIPRIRLRQPNPYQVNARIAQRAEQLREALDDAFVEGLATRMLMPDQA